MQACGPGNTLGYPQPLHQETNYKSYHLAAAVNGKFFGRPRGDGRSAKWVFFVRYQAICGSWCVACIIEEVPTEHMPPFHQEFMYASRCHGDHSACFNSCTVPSLFAPWIGEQVGIVFYLLTPKTCLLCFDVLPPNISTLGLDFFSFCNKETLCIIITKPST